MSDSNQKTALIAGASGLVGGLALNDLLAGNDYSKVTALVRKPLALKHAKLQQVITDFRNLDTLGQALAADDVFCCLGTTIKKAGSQAAFIQVDQDFPLALAKASLKLGAKHFLIVTALGAKSSSNYFYNRVKGNIEAALAALGFARLTVLRPSLLLGAREDLRFVEFLAQIFATLFGWGFFGKLKRYRPIKAKAVARALALSARQGGEKLTILESDEISKLAASVSY